MGLQGPYVYKGIKIDNAYARIDVTSSHDSNCDMSVNVYANREAWLNDQGYLEQIFPITFTRELGESVGDDKTQGYHFLKTQLDWADWVDVFDK